MDTSETIEAIDPKTFDKLLSAYPDVVPAKLAALDEQRYEEIPNSLKQHKSIFCLTEDQVSTLVDWKLSHGKFRPTLKALVKQNHAADVLSTTKDGFEAYSGTGESAKASLNILTKLKGIGPATASLLLSVYDPKTAPFFSDELFQWCFFESAKGRGWDRSIKYNGKEYLQLYEKVQELKQRFLTQYQRDIAAVEIEKVAYVLGKRSKDAKANAVKESNVNSLKRKASSDEEVSQESIAATSSTAAKKSKPMRPPQSRAGSRTSARRSKK